MNNLAKANQYNYGDHEINNQRRFLTGDGFFLLILSQNNIFENKYGIKLITLISMNHLNLL